MSQEEILEEQKRQCVFCKILSGELPSKKVYEDEHFVALLDIRPAADGHVLLLPKEHVPIMPLLQPLLQVELFKLIVRLSGVLREIRAVEAVTVFSASGAAAGQTMPHMVVHLIPRQPGDGLGVLDLNDRTVEQTDTLLLAPLLERAVTQVVQQLGRADILGKGTETPLESGMGGRIGPVPSSFEEVERPPENSSQDPPVEGTPVPGEVVEFESPNDALQAALAQNPDLKRLLIAEPALVEDYVSRSENLKRLFEGVNIKALSMALRRQEPAPGRLARDMTEEELFSFIDGNEGLRRWLLEQPEELARQVGQNPKLEAFLAGVDILDLARRYGAYRGGS